MAEDGFFSRWSRRKTQVARGEQPPEPPPAEKPRAAEAAPPLAAAPAQPVAEVPPQPVEPPPTLEDVAKLGRDSDYSRFVASDVAPDVKNAALKKLFTDPHFNVMDGLDIYIDDYGKPDPIPPAMLRQLAQSKLLGLFDDEEDKDKETETGTPEGVATAGQEPPVAGAPALPDDPAALPPLTNTATAPHEDADLQLQPHHAAGRPGAGEGPAAG
ncbi:DUF3306 domain-containing protein [Azohydromonas australica]|uniref:DUF3306 domain-containing protein n=1 Tax=Azohydromonas australica TaxID=364039 RepID=UPI0004003618|nr:DUF3306 domain-containing protein [Azohydromonas australica]